MEYALDVQHKKGKLHAIERINMLLDKGSFQEFQSGVKNHENCFGIVSGQFSYDGVITGYGYINGKKVFLYAQDFTIIGGTLGKQHGEKIAHTIRMAIEHRCPVIGINDSGGARIQEGVNSLAGYGKIFYYNTLASGYIPQISIIAGTCAGGAAYSPGLSDFIFVIDNVSNMCITGPKVVKSVTGEDISIERLGGAMMHAGKSGVAHFRSQSESECLAKVRELLDYIPHYYGEKKEDIHKILKKQVLKFSVFKNKSKEIALPKNRKQIYEVREIIGKIIDDNTFFEVQEEFAKNITIGFAKLGGILVGIVANNPEFLGVLDCDASVKGARFVRYCDCFDIPIITFVDVPGFMPGLEQEESGIIRHGAKLLYAYSEATTVKLTVILRKAYGGAYIAMCSKHLGADFVYAWPEAEIAVMGAEGAVEILYAKETKKMEREEKRKFLQQKVKEYQQRVMNVNTAIEYGYVDEILRPEDTRQRLFSDLITLNNKQLIYKINKKHGNIPM